MARHSSGPIVAYGGSFDDDDDDLDLEEDICHICGEVGCDGDCEGEELYDEDWDYDEEPSDEEEFFDDDED